MTQDMRIFRNGPIFDGTRLHHGCAAVFVDGMFARMCSDEDHGTAGQIIDLNGDILSPAYVDLQVNGGDGVLFNHDPSLATLRRMAKAHRRLGVARILPTLITDTRAATQSAIQAVIDAQAAGLAEIAGLHLEGPHLSVVRKGAHDAALIRPMDQQDIDILLAAKRNISILKMTIAPENVSLDQVRTLSQAGVLLSLGHTDAGFETCLEYFNAGASCVTHLFNAMSQLGNREPGLVGAALRSQDISAGLIADAIHVHPETIKVAMAAKQPGTGSIFLVSDAMAVAGSHHSEFALGGRRIERRDGRLTLADGTLAGADLDLTTALRVMTAQAGVSLEHALSMATSGPAGVIGLEWGLSALSDTIRISPDLSALIPE